jgi:hypothetical protein
MAEPSSPLKQAANEIIIFHSVGIAFVENPMMAEKRRKALMNGSLNLQIRHPNMHPKKINDNF